ncbi:MAG: DUF2178 domain-containing protein [Bacteroidia bacterium]
MKDIKFLNYRLGLIGRMVALFTGMAALLWYIFQGMPDELNQKVLMTIAIVGMGMAMFSKEKYEDERIDRLRMRTALFTLLFFTITYPLTQLWLLSKNEGISIQAYAIVTLAFYLIVLEISKRVV